ncbi:MAG: hypothetical protein HZB92_01860 [Euryarchaeota archaeon]|nr:hypothetical protein [Euryarchaeota archaeon]
MKASLKTSIVAIVAASLIVSGILYAIVSRNPGNGSISTSGPALGITLTPRSFQSSDFAGFFEKAKEAGSVVSWAGDWAELAGGANSGPKVLAELSGVYKYEPLVIAQFFTQSTGLLVRPLNNTTKESYKAGAVAFAEKYRPEYFAMGIEVNILYEKSVSDFNNFTSFYADVYDALKAVSPSTKVFTIFQLEKMKGLSGGLFGGANDPAASQWALLDRFPKSDLAAFTTYPCLIYKDPGLIPPDYYSEIRNHTSKPLAFTEIGWHSGADIPGWESNGSEQSSFVSRFFNATESLKPELSIWSFMYDQSVVERPFNSMGLIGGDGTDKPAWDEWTSHAKRP